MIRKISSGNYNIIDSGIIFFYEDSITIELFDDDGTKDVTIIVELVQDNSIDKPAIKSEILDKDKALKIKCINFLSNLESNGIIRPVHVADNDSGKKMYFMFYITREGKPGYIRTNTLKYTIFQEK